jgi:glutamyl-tRNA reductase
MHLICVGLSHHTAPVVLREKLAFTGSQIHAGLQALMDTHNGGPEARSVYEAVILNTCNRLEVYALVPEPQAGADTICQFLARFHNLAVEEFEPYLYVHHDDQAVEHLFRVAAGLDSMIVGESEILGQVNHALEIARGQGAAGQVLTRVFQSAVHAGSRARHETRISHRAASIPSVAVALARELRESLAGLQVLVVGAGEMGALTAKALMDQGAHGLIVSNRSYGRAVTLARQWGGCAVTFERLPEAMAQADVVISATDAPHPVIRHDTVAAVMAQRPDRPLLIIDIAVPRDVEPEVGTLPGVHLYDIDDLQGMVDRNLAERQAEIPKVEAIVAEEAAACMAWFRALDVVPTIVELRRRAEAIRQAEVEHALRRLNGLSDEEREIIEVLSKRIVNKLLHEPTVRLKRHANGHSGFYYTEAIRELFGLDGR